MQFLREVRESLYSPLFYRELLSRPFSYSLTYFLKLSAALAFVYAVLFVVLLMPDVRVFLTDASSMLSEAFPGNFAFEIENGIASTTVKQPFTVHWPGESLNVLTIDLTSSSTMATTSIVNLLRTGVVTVTPENNGGVRIQQQPYGNESFSITKGTIDEWSGAIADFAPYAAIVFIPFIFLGVFFAGLFYLVYLLPVALLVWAVMRLSGINARYGQAYRASMHLVTIAALLGVVRMLGVPLVIPYLPTLLLVVLAIVNFRSPQQKLPIG